MFKFYIDGTEVSEPNGWEQATITIERDDVIKGLIYAYTTPVIFFDDGYTAIKNLFDTGYCNKVTVLIEHECSTGVFEELFTGIIFMTDCTFDLDKCQVECSINDNHYGAKIKNNKSIKAQIDVGRSKNDETITATPNSALAMFTPSDGAGSGIGREAYSIYDTFAFLIAFMTDGEIDFDSVYFGAGGAGEDYLLTTGAAIRDTTADYPIYTSFEIMFKEIDKKFNISFYIENADPPVLFIEPTEDIYSTSESLAITNVPGIKLSVNESLLYSVVKFGGSVTQEDESTFQFPDGRFFGFKSEEYHVIGDCNIDSSLELEGDWVVDSNVIEDIIVNSEDKYDKDIFIIETDGAGNAVESDLFAVPPAVIPVVYNPSLTNTMIANRYFGGVHNSIAIFLGDGDDGFTAHKTTTNNYAFPPPASTSVEPFEMSTEDTDPNANYTAASSYYTAPSSGSYTFRIKAGVESLVFTGIGVKQLDVTVELNRYKDNTFGDLMQTITNTEQFVINGGGQTVTTGTFYLNTNEVVRGKITIAEGASNAQAIDVDIGGADTYSTTTSTFAITQVLNGGGIYKEYNPEDVRSLVYTFQYPITNTDFNTVFSQNLQKIDFEIDSGWLKRLDYSVKTGLGEWVIIT